MRNGRFSISACVQAVLALLMAVGAATFLGPCVHTEGGFGTCHWAGRVLTGLGAAMAVQAVIGMFFADARVREGVSLSMIPVALLAALTPGVVIPLCMMETMRCNAIMRPAMALIAALIGVLSAVDAILQHRRAWQGREA